jgi:hypothetical protein
MLNFNKSAALVVLLVSISVPSFSSPVLALSSLVQYQDIETQSPKLKIIKLKDAKEEEVINKIQLELHLFQQVVLNAVQKHGNIAVAKMKDQSKLYEAGNIDKEEFKASIELIVTNYETQYISEVMPKLELFITTNKALEEQIPNPSAQYKAELLDLVSQFEKNSVKEMTNFVVESARDLTMPID